MLSIVTQALVIVSQHLGFAAHSASYTADPFSKHCLCIDSVHPSVVLLVQIYKGRLLLSYILPRFTGLQSHA